MGESCESIEYMGESSESLFRFVVDSLDLLDLLESFDSPLDSLKYCESIESAFRFVADSLMLFDSLDLLK